MKVSPVKFNAKSIIEYGRRISMTKKFDKRVLKKSPEELEAYLQFQRRGSRVESKKGKGSYNRKPKHKNRDYDKCA
jgi:stalled ribosome alternative rescue factor ArfA